MKKAIKNVIPADAGVCVKKTNFSLCQKAEQRHLRYLLMKQKGQTIIETALMLLLILALLLLITEFARAWYTKNSLKNAVRHGVRVAVVTPNLAITAICPSDLCGNTAAPVSIRNSVLQSPGVPPAGPPSNTAITACFTNKPSDANANLDAGDEVKVCATTTFTYVVKPFSVRLFNLPPLWPETTPIRADASMRYE